MSTFVYEYSPDLYNVTSALPLNIQKSQRLNSPQKYMTQIFTHSSIFLVPIVYKDVKTGNITASMRNNM